MIFERPEILFFLFLIVIPVIIHIIKFRKPKEIPFPYIHLFEQIQKKAKRKLQIKKWLLLANRILIIIFIVLFFSSPSCNKSDKAKNIGIFFDNSGSMLGATKGISIKDFVIRKMLDIGSKFSESKISVITPQEILIKEEEITLNEIAQILSSYSITPSTYSFSKFKPLLAPYEKIMILSDLQKSNFSDEDIRFLKEKNAIIISPQISEIYNAYIDTFFIEPPFKLTNEKIYLKTRICFTTEKNNISLSIVLNDKIISNNLLKPNSGKCLDTSFSYVPDNTYSWEKGKIIIEGDEFSPDDTFYFIIPPMPPLKAIYIGEGDTYIYSALFNLPNFSLAINYSDTSSSILIIEGISKNNARKLQLINYYISQNKTIIILPAPEDTIFQILDDTAYPDTTFVILDPLSIDKNFFQGIFEEIPNTLLMPEFHTHFVQNKSQGIPLIKFNDGHPLLSYTKVGNSKIFIFWASISKSSNLAYHPIFPAIFLKLCLSAIPINNQSNYFSNEFLPGHHIMIMGQDTIFTASNFPKKESQTQYYSDITTQELLLSQNVNPKVLILLVISILLLLEAIIVKGIRG